MRLLALLFLLYSCSSNTTISGGTGTETTNGIAVISPAGEPLTGATVSIVQGATWYDSIAQGKSPVTVQLTSDNRGIIPRDSLEGAYTFSVRHGSLGAIVLNPDSVIVLDSLAELNGTAVGEDSVFIAGTDKVVPVQSDGTFQFTGIPKNALSLFTKSGTKISPAATVDLSSTAEVSITSQTGLLFEDFTTDYSLTPLAPVTAGVVWYGFSDSVHKSFGDGEWYDEKLSTHNGNSSLAISSDLNAGTALLQATLVSGAPYPFSGMGAAVFGKDWRSGFSIPTLSGISLKVRGTGTVELFLETARHDSLELSHYNYPIALNDQWEEISIPLDSFHLLPEDSAVEDQFPLSESLGDLRRVEFLFRSAHNSLNTPLTVEIDNIRFEGVERPF